MTSDGFYSDGQRQLQDAFGTRPLADALAGRASIDGLNESEIAFISGCDFCFLSTVDADGMPTVSYKGGAPGFVQVIDPVTLLIPSYDGNGMFMSLGNIATGGAIGLLFMDFVSKRRLRVQATAELVDDPAVLDSTPGAQAVIRATLTAAFANCGRYIHDHATGEQSPYVPTGDTEAPLPAWKRLDMLQPVLPDNDRRRAEQLGTITPEEYQDRVRRGRP